MAQKPSSFIWQAKHANSATNALRISYNVKQGFLSMAKKIGAEKQDAKLMVNYRLRASVLAAVAKAAKEDSRSATGMVGKILSDWLRERGYLK